MQYAPSARVKGVEEPEVVWVQVEEPSKVKFDVDRLGLSPVAGRLKVRVALPSFATTAVRGSSVVSDVPAPVTVGKASAGGVASAISVT
jgi:hypothetical protein